ncbi:MAG: branched-chain amino acid transport system permease protein [Chloroflexi bacterium]|jgi:branched-chain amino acid transport system permease protein|nr:MAG: branched-chain amino acid transport system permease protein [Chloroflexota bacterium]
MDYFLHLVVLGTIYSILAVSLNISVGYTGLLTLAHAAFYGVGAYAVGILTVEYNVNFFFALLLAMPAAGVVAAMVSPILRLKGHFFILGTVAVQLMLTQVLFNWISLTKGPFGIPGVPSPVIFGLKLNTPPTFLLLSVPVMIIVVLLAARLVNSPFGRVLKTIRANPSVAESIGINVDLYRLRVFVITAMMAGVAGGLYASYTRYVHPSAFDVVFSTFILIMVILGGTGRWMGSVLGVVGLITIQESVRFIPALPANMVGPVQIMAYSGVLFAVMMLRPQGLIGAYKLE